MSIENRLNDAPSNNVHEMTDWSSGLVTPMGAKAIAGVEITSHPGQNWSAVREAEVTTSIKPDSNDYFVDPNIKASRLNRIHKAARIVYLLSSTNRMVPGL